MVLFMGIIPCDSNCKYQKDGYCMLESIEKVNNCVISQGCAYFVENDKNENSTKFKNNLNN